MAYGKKRGSSKAPAKAERQGGNSGPGKAPKSPSRKSKPSHQGGRKLPPFKSSGYYDSYYRRGENGHDENGLPRGS